MSAVQDVWHEKRRPGGSPSVFISQCTLELPLFAVHSGSASAGTAFVCSALWNCLCRKCTLEAPLPEVPLFAVLCAHGKLCSLCDTLVVRYARCAIRSLCAMLVVRYARCALCSLCDMLVVRYARCAIRSLCDMLLVHRCEFTVPFL